MGQIRRLKDRSVVPQEGWRFQERTSDTWLTSRDFVSLVRLVQQHRRANAIPCGDYAETEREVEGQICSRLPSDLSFALP